MQKQVSLGQSTARARTLQDICALADGFHAMLHVRHGDQNGRSTCSGLLLSSIMVLARSSEQGVGAVSCDWHTCNMMDIWSHVVRLILDTVAHKLAKIWLRI